MNAYTAFVIMVTVLIRSVGSSARATKAIMGISVMKVSFSFIVDSIITAYKLN